MKPRATAALSLTRQGLLKRVTCSWTLVLSWRTVSTTPVSITATSEQSVTLLRPTPLLVRVMESSLVPGGDRTSAVSLTCFCSQTYNACIKNILNVSLLHPCSFTAMACPANSHYTLCASACPTTCASLTSVNKCHKACVEGCECDDGHLLSGDTCVPVKECGCSYDGHYYRKGDIFYPDTQCEEKCVCGETGAISCQKNKCPRGETCKILNGVNGCHPIKHDKCVASGDPHYISFDKRQFDFQGTCSYVLAKACNLDQSSLTPFTVIQRNQRFGNGNVAVTKTITVQVFGYDIIIKQGMSWKVLVSSETLSTRECLPFDPV